MLRHAVSMSSDLLLLVVYKLVRLTIGDTAGTVDNIITCKLHRPGSVAFASKSGGLSNEMYNVLARVTDGLYEGIAVGGDAFPGTTLTDHVKRFEKLDAVKLIVVLGEPGGADEYGIVDSIKSGEAKKPVVAWVTGSCASQFNAALSNYEGV